MGTEIIMKYLAVSPIERLGLPLLLVILLRKELAVKFGVDVQQALCQISPHLCVQRVAPVRQSLISVMKLHNKASPEMRLCPTGATRCTH